MINRRKLAQESAFSSQDAQQLPQQPQQPQMGGDTQQSPDTQMAPPVNRAPLPNPTPVINPMGMNSMQQATPGGGGVNTENLMRLLTSINRRGIGGY